MYSDSSNENGFLPEKSTTKTHRLSEITAHFHKINGIRCETSKTEGLQFQWKFSIHLLLSIKRKPRKPVIALYQLHNIIDKHYNNFQVQIGPHNRWTQLKRVRYIWGRWSFFDVYRIRILMWRWPGALCDRSDSREKYYSCTLCISRRTRLPNVTKIAESCVFISIRME